MTGRKNGGQMDRNNYYQISVPIGKKCYSFPIKWLVNYVADNTNYETMILFTKHASEKEKKEAISHAKAEEVGKYIW